MSVRRRNIQNACLALSVLVSSTFMLSGCEVFLGHKVIIAGIVAAQNGVFSSPDVNLKAKNYAAADYLAVQIQDHIKKYDHIEATPLEEQDHAGISSSLGYKISEGVGLRLHELGYSVVLDKVASVVGKGADVQKQSSTHYVLGGAYTVKKDEIDVYLRVLNKESGAIIGRFDYTMPLSKEIENMAKTDVKIFKIKAK